MPTATIDGRSIHLDAEGFLTDPSEWDQIWLGFWLARSASI